MILKPPTHFNRGEVKKFLSESSFIYKCINKREKGFILDLSEIQDISLLGQLLIYKFISFTARNGCFENPLLQWNRDFKIHNQFRKSGFFNIMQTYVETPKDWPNIKKSYQEMHLQKNDNFFFAPHSLLRKEESSRNTVEQIFLNEVSNFYSDNKKISIISICIGELIGNFWAHATEDSDTVLVAKGGNKFIELFFADSGQGIISTLRESNSYYRKMDSMEILKQACEPGVSSKKESYHQGFGLFLVRMLAQKNHGSLSIYSENCYINLSEKGIRTEQTGYWKGTIIVLRLDLNSPITIASLNLKPIDPRITWRRK